MSQQSAKARIVQYYNATKREYRLLWRSNRSLGLHFGYYDARHKTHDAAVLNINRKLADLMKITANDHVLDAGCGIGGSSLWAIEVVAGRA